MKKDLDKKYMVLRKKFLGDHSLCQLRISKDCALRACDVHHKYSGKDRSKYYLEVSTWKATCRQCHDWCHLNSLAARELGLLM